MPTAGEEGEEGEQGEEAYQRLSGILSSGGALEISRLAATATRSEFSAPHLGLSTRELQQAFAHAHGVFFSGGAGAEAEAVAASGVLLLCSSEHGTALGVRRRALQRQATPAMVAAELTLTESLVTSGLARHSKSPALWGHRRWVRARFAGGARGAGAAELDVVRRSAQAHPRNYYAWEHARWVGAAMDGEESAAALRAQVGWCRRHVADVSGWTFLAWLLDRAAPPLRAQVLADTLEYATVVPGHEALWAFVRIAARGVGRDAWLRALRGVAWEAYGDGEERARDRMLRERTCAWLDRWAWPAAAGGHGQVVDSE